MDRLLGLLIDSFPKILIPGLTVTIPLTVIAFSIAMVIAVAAALAQFAQVPVATQLCRFYIWVFRGTPLLVQLFVVFYGLTKVGLTLSTARRPSGQRWRPSQKDSWRRATARG